MSREIEEIKLISELSSNCLVKLRNNSFKEHWIDTDIDMLIQCLRKEVIELEEAITEKKSIEDVWREAGDVANFAAMIADKYDKEVKDF